MTQPSISGVPFVLRAGDAAHDAGEEGCTITLPEQGEGGNPTLRAASEQLERAEVDARETLTAASNATSLSDDVSAVLGAFVLQAG